MDRDKNIVYGTSMIELVVVVAAFIIIVNILSSISEDINIPSGEPSTEKGTTGLIIVLLTGIGVVYSINAYQMLMASPPEEKMLYTPPEHDKYVGSGERQSKIGENMGLAGLVLRHTPGAKLKFKGDHSHDYSSDPIREAEEEEIARESRLYQQQQQQMIQQQQQRRIQELPNTTNIYYINKPRRRPIIGKRKTKKQQRKSKKKK